jgi:hypothetical protein
LKRDRPTLDELGLFDGSDGGSASSNQSLNPTAEFGLFLLVS